MQNFSRMKTARIAGALYLLLIISGITGLMYVPSQLIAWDNPAKTVANLTGHQLLFKIGMLSEMVCYLSFIFLALALFHLLKEVSRSQAILMVIFVLISIPISFVNLLDKFSILTLLSEAGYLDGHTTEALASQIMMHLDFYGNGNKVAFIFWGLWLFPFGYLVYWSGFLPKVLGVFLMLGCLGYLIEFAGPFLFSTYHDHKTLATLIGMPSTIGEFGICLWLLFMGSGKLRPADN